MKPAKWTKLALEKVKVVDSVIVFHHLSPDLGRVDPGDKVLHATSHVKGGIRHHLGSCWEGRGEGDAAMAPRHRAGQLPLFVSL